MALTKKQKKDSYIFVCNKKHVVLNELLKQNNVTDCRDAHDVIEGKVISDLFERTSIELAKKIKNPREMKFNLLARVWQEQEEEDIDRLMLHGSDYYEVLYGGNRAAVFEFKVSFCRETEESFIFFLIDEYHADSFKIVDKKKDSVVIRQDGFDDTYARRYHYNNDIDTSLKLESPPHTEFHIGLVKDIKEKIPQFKQSFIDEKAREKERVKNHKLEIIKMKAIIDSIT